MIRMHRSFTARLARPARCPRQRPSQRPSQRGVVALEFALVSVPFFVMLIGTLEIAFAYFRAAMLEGATGDAARFIRVGGAGAFADPVQEFQDRLCSEVQTIACGDLQFEAIAYPNFGDASEDVPMYDEDGNLVVRGFEPGSPRDVILVKVAFRHRFFTPLIGDLIDGTIDNAVTITSHAIFENEPWDDQGL